MPDIKNDNSKFPSLKKSINDFINDEDGNITRGGLITVGTMVMLMSVLSYSDVFAGHVSHISHSSHGSTSYVRDHTNHSSHSNSHGSHSSHSSHTSHSNVASHDNSLYSKEGDVSYGPKVSSIDKFTQEPQDDVFVETPATEVAYFEMPEIKDLPEMDPVNGIGDVDVDEK